MSDKPFYMTQAAILFALAAMAMSASGCEVIGGIFKAGVWVGVIIVVIIVGLIVMFMRRRG
jgi:hypothetical protein